MRASIGGVWTVDGLKARGTFRDALVHDSDEPHAKATSTLISEAVHL